MKEKQHIIFTGKESITRMIREKMWDGFPECKFGIRDGKDDEVMLIVTGEAFTSTGLAYLKGYAYSWYNILK